MRCQRNQLTTRYDNVDPSTTVPGLPIYIHLETDSLLIYIEPAVDSLLGNMTLR